MSKITKERLASVIISFFTVDTRRYSYYRLAKKTGLDSQTLKAWECQERNSIREEAFQQLIEGLDQDLKNSFKTFSEHAIKVLKEDGNNEEFLQEVFNPSSPFPTIINTLLQGETDSERYLQEKLGTEGITRILKDLLSQHHDYFQVAERSLLVMDDPIVYFSHIDLLNMSINNESASQEPNYVIIKFPSAYNGLIILSNDHINYHDNEMLDYFAYRTEKLKAQNKIKIVLIITDIDENKIPFEKQSLLMERCNLFFEFVKKRDVGTIPIQGLKLASEDIHGTLKSIDQYRYAQLIYERLMSYLSVISVEILFKPFLETIIKELDSNNKDEVNKRLQEILVPYNAKTNMNDLDADEGAIRKKKKKFTKQKDTEKILKATFLHYADQTLLKKICDYSYLSRHTIYYERNMVHNEVQRILSSKGLQKLPLVVEICAPNSLTTSSIIDNCERLLLFTASHNAYSLMKKLQDKTEGRFLPSNISLQLCHLNPEYMMHQYPDELNGKVDFLVIGFGAGSQITDLTRFIRYAYNWLTEDGVLFISVYNRKFIVFDRSQLRDQRFENSPSYMSDYWIYAPNERVPLLKTLKAYSTDDFVDNYFSLFDSEDISLSTYPYLSTLINPSDYSRSILDEIRSADKLFAKQGIRGQLICVVAHKNKSDKSLLLFEKIQNLLDSEKIDYTPFSHTLAPDSNGLKQSLQIIKALRYDTTLLKTVILQKRGRKSQEGNNWIYTILPYNERVPFDDDIYELVQESAVIKEHNQGTVSPLTILAEDADRRETIYLLYNDSIVTEYVIMSGGSNTKSIRIHTKDFMRLAEERGAIIRNSVE